MGDLRFAPPALPLPPTAPAASAPGPGWYWGVDDEAEEENLDD